MALADIEKVNRHPANIAMKALKYALKTERVEDIRAAAYVLEQTLTPEQGQSPPEQPIARGTPNMPPFGGS